MFDRIKELWYPEGHLNEDQRDFLISFLSIKQIDFVLEIGFATGRSTVTILESAKPQKMVSIDIDLDYMGARNHSKKMMEEYPNLKIIEGNSQQLINDEFMNEEFPMFGVDFGFIDGGHTEIESYSDISNTFNCLNRDGFLIVDDYESGPPNGCQLIGVNNAVNRFCRERGIQVQKWYKNGKGMAIIYAY